jgi:ABC-2 type transport system ATP-binding protein
MIRLKNISKKFNDLRVLDELDVTIESGEIYGFLGHNGAGKTTTLKIINGFLKPDQGRVVFDNDKLRIGYMPETPAFYQYLSLKEYLKLIASQCRIKISESEMAVLIEKVGLKGFEGKRISNYSKGMRQRAALACALIDDPDVLLLDEPLSALDPEGRRDVMDIIYELKTMGKTILISTHILSDVENICDRIGVLKQGKMIIEKSLDDLKKAYVYPIVDICINGEAKGLEADMFQYIERVLMEGNCYSFYMKDMIQGKLEIMKYLIDHRVEIISINQRNSSLEDIYLEVTKVGFAV